MMDSDVHELIAQAQAEIDETGASHYRLTSVLGMGTYGTVFAAVNTVTSTQVAIKEIGPDHLTECWGYKANRVLREISIMHHFRKCPKVAGLVDLLPVPFSFERLYVVTDLMDCDLEAMFCQLKNEELVKRFIYQILLGLLNLNKARILHRDLKPGNVLVNDKTYDIKICDFGFARGLGSAELEEDPRSPYVGTPSYRAPELVCEQTNYTNKVDVWAAGCILAQMLTPNHRSTFHVLMVGNEMKTIVDVLGTPSEEDMAWISSEEVRASIARGVQNNNFLDKLKTPDGQPLSDEGKDLIRQMLAFNPHKRVDVLGALRHPYLRSQYRPEDEQFVIRPFEVDKSVDESDLGNVRDAIRKLARFIRQTAEMETIESVSGRV